MTAQYPSSMNTTGSRLRRVALGLLLGLMISAPTGVLAESSAIILMYHRFDEADYPSTNTTLEQLDAHIAELTSGPYTVLPVGEIVDRLRDGKSLPDRTVGITIDDAYRSIYTKAWPKFKQASLPFTIFVATGQVDQRSSRHLTWDQIREMRDGGGVDIGHHTVSHLHMPEADATHNAAEIRNASARFVKELGSVPPLFSYPYGELSLQIGAAIRNAGFKAAFGQHSGVIGGIGDLFSLPRFAMNEKYGDLARFRMVANALALPVQDVTPAEHLIGDRNPPAIGFTLKNEVPGINGLACFTSHDGRAQLERLGPVRVEVRVDKPFPKGRTRLNCTLRTPDGRWRWLGRQFLKLD